MNTSDADLRKKWRDAGGEFYGPHVETGSMPEAKLLSFLRSLITAAVKGEPEPVAWLRHGPDGDAFAICDEDADGAFAVFATAQRADAGMREALKTAIGHIEHMSAWIALRNAGYSFESLGEDMPGIRAAFDGPAVAAVRDDGHSGKRAGADGLSVSLERDWKTIEEQIATAQGNDFLALIRDYFVINREPGDDLAPLYIARIGSILASEQDAVSGPDHVLMVTYTNWRGETAVRRIVPKGVRFASTKWHPEPQWLLLAWDADKRADREFALKDFGAPVAEARKTALTNAMTAVEELRINGAANFTNPRYAGQRGADHADALYDAYHAIKSIRDRGAK